MRAVGFTVVVILVSNIQPSLLFDEFIKIYLRTKVTRKLLFMFYHLITIKILSIQFFQIKWNNQTLNIRVFILMSFLTIPFFR